MKDAELQNRQSVDVLGKQSSVTPAFDKNHFGCALKETNQISSYTFFKNLFDIAGIIKRLA